VPTPHPDSDVRVRSALPHPLPRQSPSAPQPIHLASNPTRTDQYPTGRTVNATVMKTPKPVLSPALSPSEEITATDLVATRGLCSREDAEPDHWLPSIVDRPPNEDRLRRARARADRQCRIGAEPGKAQCGARTACLLLAVSRGEKYGIWGGLIPGDLADLGKNLERMERLQHSYRTGGAEPSQTAADEAGLGKAGRDEVQPRQRSRG
jgi:hypothetical protein